MDQFLDLFRKRNPVAISLVLAVSVICAYLPTFQNGFVNLDDPLYVVNNPHVQHGLSSEGIKYAFTTFERGFWHPLTWLSLMLDREIYSPGAWGFHLTSLLFHVTNTVLLFVILRRMTGATWRSAMVAGLFGLHPLHVESVAWASERKDVLSTFFMMLTLLAYAKYAKQRGEGRSEEANAGSPWTWYALALLFFALGLMSKTMLVTLPLMLLLLDWWPLGRFGGSRNNSQPSTPQLSTSTWPFLLEKLPFFALSLAAGMLTLHSQGAVGAIQDVARVPIQYRLENAMLAYVRYLVQTVWPLNLAGYYAFPTGFSMVAVSIAIVLLALISIVCLRASRKRPYLTFGWIWYVVTLLPVIGFIYVGSQSQADRYTYIPLIGIFALVVWWIHDVTPRDRRTAVAASVVPLLICCGALTWRQVGFWKDGVILFTRALQVTTYNPLAHNNLGTALFDLGRMDEAILHFQEALRQSPQDPSAHQNLGAALFRRGRVDEAIPELEAAVRLNPGFAAAHCNLGAALGTKGRVDEAIREFQTALALQPENRDAKNYLKFALSEKAASSQPPTPPRKQ